jgi:hypothetical protein
VTYISRLYPGEQIIDDATPVSLANSGYVPRDYASTPFGALPGAVPFNGPLIPRGDWAAMIEERERKGQLLSQIVLSENIESLDQAGTNYCWANCVVTAIESLRAANGLPTVKLSPASVAAPIMEFKNQGGWPDQAVEYIATNGVCPAEKWPANAIDRRYFTQVNRGLAMKYRITEWWELPPRSFDALMTCLLTGVPAAVGYLWWHHAVCDMDPVVIGSNRFGVRFRNSWKNYGDLGFAILDESRGTPDGGVAPRVVTVV